MTEPNIEYCQVRWKERGFPVVCGAPLPCEIHKKVTMTEPNMERGETEKPCNHYMSWHILDGYSYRRCMNCGYIDGKKTFSEVIDKAYKEGLTENIEKLERTSEKYKTLLWCIREDGIENVLEAMGRESVDASQCRGIKVVPLHLFQEAIRSKKIKV